MVKRTRKRARKSDDWRILARAIHDTIVAHYEARGTPGIAIGEVMAVFGTVLTSYFKTVPHDDRIELRDAFIRGLLESTPREQPADELGGTA